MLMKMSGISWMIAVEMLLKSWISRLIGMAVDE